MLSGIPLLVVHGDVDHYFPLEHPRAIHESARRSGVRTDLWIERGFGHAESSVSTEVLDRIGGVGAGMRRRCRGFRLHMTGVWVLLGVLAVATVFGLWFKRTSGRITDRPAPVPAPVAVDAGRVVVGRDPGGRRRPARSTSSPTSRRRRRPLSPPPWTAGSASARRWCSSPAPSASRAAPPGGSWRRSPSSCPGVSHVEIDAEDNLDLVRALDIRRTPTVLFLDAAGVVRKHASGQPRKADVIAALGDLMPAPRATPGRPTSRSEPRRPAANRSQQRAVLSCATRDCGRRRRRLRSIALTSRRPR